MSCLLVTKSYSQEEHNCLIDTTGASNKSNYQSWQGYYHQISAASIKPTGTYRLLNIMVNIHYDQTPDLDPAQNGSSTWWPSTTVQGINNQQNLPTYLTDFMDYDYNPNNVNGMMTRIFYESSFGDLILLGDFMVVDIKQSYITPNSPGGNFDQNTLRSKVFDLINEYGGLNTIYGHNSLADYDSDANGKIDMVQFLLRNTRKTNDLNINFGGVNQGGGNITPRTYSLIIDGTLTSQTSIFSYQGVGSGLSHTLNPTGIITHEFAHALFGGNNFHTSGGNHYTGGGTNTFFGVEGGYGLMGAANSGLISCNGYERWRIKWISPSEFNPAGHEIQANGVLADISKEDGNKSFIIRDFVTYGDAIRIRLPYKDDGTSNQYIWLENHQIGKNNKLDYLQYSLYPDGSIYQDCRPIGTPGIYSYIQVGKTEREGEFRTVYPLNETDNLRIISAEGNWDFENITDEAVNCVSSAIRRTEKKLLSNPLSGYQDQTEHFFENNPAQQKLTGNDGDMISTKYSVSGSLISNSLPFLGDNLDAFTGRALMNIGSNPSPVNATTYYVTQSGSNQTPKIINVSNANINNSNIYLSGLRVYMVERTDGTFLVSISWDDYEVTQDVRWTGNIVLKEKVILSENKTITLDQSLTPNQLFRDPVSEEFSKPTVFTCEESSEFILKSHSTLKVQNKSTLHLKEGSTFIIEDNAELIIDSDTLRMDPCAKLIIKGDGKLTVRNNGVLCISEGAVIATDKGYSNIVLNVLNIPSGYVHPNSLIPSTTQIIGSKTWQNKTYFANTLTIGNGAILTIKNSQIHFANNQSKLIILPGGKLIVDNSTITNSCGDYWQGIYVEGDINLPQTAENQGTLILNNGAIIENARTAVNVSGVDDNWESNGGIVQANNARFINNWRNVAFSAYPNPNIPELEINNVSYFTDVDFITNDQTIHNEHTNNVSMWSIKGVSFVGCNFADNRTNIDFITSNKARNGIYTSTASFYVSGSEFTNMKYGIYANSYNADHNFKVYNSTFNSYRGIYFNATDNVKLLGNDFTVAPGYSYSSDAGRCDETYGVYINSSSNYTIEDNDFYSSSNGSTSCGSVGIIARNTGSYTNELYRNDFDGFTVGIEALGINRGDWSHEGLELKCNRLDNGAWDFYIDYDVIDAINSGSGIREMQGYASIPSVTSPAGNLFGNRSPILISNFVNKVRPISYFHHRPKNESRVIPAIYSSNITLYEIDKDYTYSTSCPQRIHPKSLDELVAEKQDAQTHYEETSVLLQAHVDDGNTQLMTQQVEMAGEGDAYNTYQYLMQTSPYLSEEVLTSLGAKEEGFNNAMIRDVMVENPQSAKSEEVNLALDSRIDQLPAYMRWQINNGLFQFSEKEIMEQFIAYQKTRHDQALNQIIMGVMHKQEGFENAPSLDQLLAQVDDVRYQYMRAELKFAEEDYAAGLQQLNLVAQQYDLYDEDALQAHQDKTDFYTLLAQWSNHEDHPGFTNLPQEVLLQLESYLEATPRVAGKALSLLMLNDAIVYEEPILYPQEGMLPKTDPVSGPVEFIAPDVNSELRFALFPNPSTDYLTLDWCIESPRMAESGKIEFRNATGVLVHTMATDIPCNQQILPLDGWKSGTYTATITLNNQLRKTITFVVAQ